MSQTTTPKKSFELRFLEFLLPVQPFVAGGIAGCIATTVIQPVDYVKTQMQLQGEGERTATRVSPINVARATYNEFGFTRFYTGITAAWTRQIVYGSARLGLFRVFSDELKVMHHGAPLPVWEKIGAGLAAGALAALIGNPADLALVRMQADTTLPPAQRRNYKGIVDAVVRIIRQEGVLALWRGSTPTAARAMALNASMLATSDQLKELFGPMMGGQQSAMTMVTSSILSGIAAAFASLPFDMVKTRLQKMKAGPDGKMPYKGFFDCVRKIAVNEGPLAFYKGIDTYMFRIAPHAILVLLVLDNLNIALNDARAKARKAYEASLQ